MIKDSIGKVVAGENLSQEEAFETMGRIMSGEATPAQIACFITALRLKGETVDEMKQSLGIQEAKIVTYYRSGGDKSTIYSGVPSDTPHVVNLIGLNIGDLSRFEGVRFMYLWRP